MTADNVDSLLCSVGEVSGGRLRRVHKDACAELKDVTVLSLQRIRTDATPRRATATADASQHRSRPSSGYGRRSI